MFTQLGRSRAEFQIQAYVIPETDRKTFFLGHCPDPQQVTDFGFSEF